MSDDRALAAIMSLDAAISQLQAIRITLAQSVVPQVTQDDEHDTPKDVCSHTNRKIVVTMGTGVSLCPDCGEQFEGDT